jgi:hypothetical protein
MHEITRYFDFTFISGKEFLEIDNFLLRLKATQADGIIYAVIPQSQAELKKLETEVKKLKSFDRLIVVLPTECVQIEKDIFEYEAAITLRAGVSDDEPILADEYDIYIDDLAEVIGEFINGYARPENSRAKYFYKGKQQAIFRKAKLSGLLSHICTEVFCNTPIINNESINKNKLTTQTLNSCTKILAGLLDNELKPNLGLVGTGQEVSIMRSVLVQTEILDLSDAPQINLEPSNEKMANMLAVIQGFFAEAMTSGELNFSLLYDRLTRPEHRIGLKKGVVPVYLAVVLHLNKQNLVIKHGKKEVKLTADLLNDINEIPSDYSVVIEDWNKDKANYIAALEEIFKKYVVEREKTYNGFAYIVLAMNRWYMNLPKYAKEFKSETPSHIKFKNSLKTADENPREYIFERLVKMFGKKKPSAELAEMIKITKIEYDNAIPQLINKLSAEVKTLFSNRNGITLSTSISDWHDKLKDHTLKRLFKNNESHILNLLSSVDNDESTFIQRLAKTVSGLRIEDWTNETVSLFLRELAAFKETIDEYNKRRPSKTSENAEYKIEFASVGGEKITRTFGRAEYSDTAQLMLGEVSRVVDEYNQSISEEEKRQVLIEILEKLCLGEM